MPPSQFYCIWFMYWTVVYLQRLWGTVLYHLVLHLMGNSCLLLLLIVLLKNQHQTHLFLNAVAPVHGPYISSVAGEYLLRQFTMPKMMANSFHSFWGGISVNMHIFSGSSYTPFHDLSKDRNPDKPKTSFVFV